MFDFWTWVFVLQILVAAYTISHILRRRKEPTAMLAWIFSVLLLPLVGAALYGLIGSTRVRRKARKRRRRVLSLIQSINREAANRAKPHGSGTPEALLPDDLAPVARLSQRLVEIP